MRFMLMNHQGKGEAYRNALLLKYEEVEKNPDFVFTDQAIFGRQHRLSKLKAQKYFLYPHSGRPNLAGDWVPTWNRINAEFVAAEGHREIMRSFGHDKPIHVVGWSLCEIKPFTPSDRIENILFAPIHHRCHEMDKQLNRIVFAALKNMRAKVTVRFIKNLESCGLKLEHHPNVEYVQGDTTPSTEQIDKADVVVGHQTFGYLGVARGKPTVMFGEDMKTHFIRLDEPVQFPKNWDRYHHMMRYPLDFQDDTTMKILEKATRYRDDVEEWKKRMIGEQFDADKLLQKVRGYL